MTGTDIARFTHKSSRSYMKHLLHPRGIVLLEKLRKLVKKSPTFYETPRFITVFTTAHHLSLSRARLI